jgi:hypothetical protein
MVMPGLPGVTPMPGAASFAQVARVPLSSGSHCPAPASRTCAVAQPPAAYPSESTLGSADSIPCAGFTNPLAPAETTVPAIPPAPAWKFISWSSISTTAGTAESEKAYIIDLKFVEVPANGDKQVMTCPRLTFLEGKPAVVQVGNWVGLTHGTIQDLTTQTNYVSPEDRVRLGSQMRVKVTGLENDWLRVDLAVEKTDVEKADKKSIVVLGKSLRTVQRVRLDKPVKVILSKDKRGAAQSWVEFTVTQEKD